MIEVEFHNAGIHHTFSIPNHCGYTMAALSEQALVLACERSEDVARCVSVCLLYALLSLQYKEIRNEAIMYVYV